MVSTKHKVIIGTLVCIVVISAVVIPTTIVLVNRNNDNKKNDAITKTPIRIPDNATTRTLTMINDLSNLSSWNVVRYVYGKNNWMSVDNETVKVVYPANSVNPSLSEKRGGFIFYVSPNETFPTDEIYLSYNVMFEIPKKNHRKLLQEYNDFLWVRGGMLPGLWIGKMGAQDSNHLDDGSSYRVMWRKNGVAEAYLYVPRQDSSYYNLPGYVDNKPFGESLFRGFSRFVAGQWNTIIMRIKLNDVGKNNGVLQLSINDKTMTFDKMVWRNTETIQISGITMHSFFGGSDETWATPVEQNIYFSKFTLST